LNYQTFGQLLKALRLEKGWTQDEACKGICDKRTYLRWEKDISEPSVYYFNLLSKHFNYDLHAYYQFLNFEKSAYVLSYKQKIQESIKNNNWEDLYQYAQELKKLKDFKSGENKAILMYGLALYYYNQKQDYETSLKYSLEGLKEENPAISKDRVYENIYSNIGLCLLNCYGVNLAKLEQQQEAINIFSNILKNIENKLSPYNMQYHYTEFEKRLYQTITLNLTLNYKRQNKLETALEYANKGIDFSNKFYFMEFLGDLLELKYNVLYELGNYQESKKTYDLCIHLYLLQNRMDHYKKCISSLDDVFSELKKLQ